MKHQKLTPAEEKRLAEAFVAQAMAMGLKANKKLPGAIKAQVRERVLNTIRAEREALKQQEARRTEYEAAENSFSWQPLRRR